MNGVASAAPALHAALLATALLSAAAPVAAHDGTFLDVYTKSFQNCAGCHVSEGDPGQAGGLAPEHSEDGWRNALVGAVPTNEAARAHGKLRVHEYLPWNSYLLDKLTGHLKAGEGRAMRSKDPATDRPGSVGLPSEEEDCPGLVSEVYNWILGGAVAVGFAPGDDSKFAVTCERTQPFFPAVPVPAGGQQVDVFVVDVEAPALEAADAVTVSLANAAELLAGRIDVIASPGTEYVTVRRSADEAPLVVARGQRDPLTPVGKPPGGEPDLFVRATIALPEGVAIRLAPGQELVIEQRLRNDYWLTEGAAGNPHADRHYNKTSGRVVVSFHPVPDPAAVEHLAVPFIEDTGTQGILVAPWGLGATGAEWIPETASTGAVVGLWTDQRAARATLSEPGGAPLNLGDVSRGYVAVGGGAVPLAGVSYACAHSNGLTDNPSSDARPYQTVTAPGTAQLVSRPLRWGCEESAGLPAGSPPGLPGEPATTCHRSTEDLNDCAGIGTERCVPANLVGGPGVEDGRCTLVGLAW